jgi:hypothetical protein
MMADSDDDDGVGYQRPPKASQFRKGHSGNPRGRPKGATSFKTDLAAELRETLVLTENGREKRITKQRALIKTLTAAAIKKDIRAVSALLACMRIFGVGAEESAPPETAQSADLDFLEAYLAGQRQRQTRTGETTDKGSAKAKSGKRGKAE